MAQAPSPDPRNNEPLRDGTSLMAYLHVLRKAHIALVGRDKGHQRFQQVVTRGHAKKYIEELMPLLLAERDRHRKARRSDGLRHT